MGLLSSLFSGINARRERKALVSGSEQELVELAQGFVQGGQGERALALLRRAVERFPHSSAIAQALEAVENTVAWKAIHTTLPHLETDDSPELRARVAEMYWKVNDTASALHWGREAIQIDPENPCGYRVVGKIYLDQFRLTGGSIEGMNALRCLFKAHTLAPEDSGYLLKLAEIFVILGAPIAASKFLLPVKRAFENDAQVVHLAKRIESLPPEETTQIQDLFLRLEEKERGEKTRGKKTIGRLSEDLRDELAKIVSALDDEGTCYMVDGDRKIVWARAEQTFDEAAFGESFGILADTARQISRRMGIGEFQRLHIQSPEVSALLGALDDGFSLVHLSPGQKRQDKSEAILERVQKKVAQSVARDQQ